MALPVEIVRSTRRRKTVQAVLGDGVIRVHVPARMSQREIDTYVAELVPKLERRLRSDHIDLEARATALARRFHLPMPTSIAWAANQRRRWGSCQPSSGRIRISEALAGYPPWVLDYVVVHELTHLVHADHSPAFTALVDRYPRAERARGYLLAMAERTRPADASDPADRLEPFDDTDDTGDPDDPGTTDDLDDLIGPDLVDVEPMIDDAAVDQAAIDDAFAIIDLATSQLDQLDGAQGRLPLD